jgi:hypothetical protein
MIEIDEEVRRKQNEKIKARDAESLETKIARANMEYLEKEEAKYAPPLITEPRCLVCNSSYRLWIERQLLKGLSYSAIANSIPPEKYPDGKIKKIERRSIANHSKNHMPLDQAVMRAVMEEEADLLNQNWEEGVKGAFTNRGALNALIRKAYDNAMNNVTVVEPRDMIQMIKLYSEMEANSAITATEEAKMTVRIFMEAITNVFDEILDKEQADTIKQAIVKEVKRLRSRDEIDVEVEHQLRIIPKRV